MIYADWRHEVSYLELGKKIIVGLDEVGRGCWAGPLVACAYAFLAIPTDIQVGDSKKHTFKQRTHLVESLKQLGAYGIGEVSAQEIDSLGLQKAQYLAYDRALTALALPIDVVFLDGRSVSWQPNFRHREGKGRGDLPPQIASSPAPRNDILLECIIDGDANVASIAAASILAKVHRDTLMQTVYHEQYPNYGFDKHVGYGTAMHQIALREFGVTSLHRKSFSPIKKLISK